MLFVFELLLFLVTSCCYADASRYWIDASRYLVVTSLLLHCTKNDVSIKDFFSKCDQMWPDLVTFTKEILNGKLRFLCSGPYFRLLLVNSRYFWLRLVSKGLFIWDISRRPDISYKCDNCHPTWVRWFTSQLVRVSFFKYIFYFHCLFNFFLFEFRIINNIYST